MSYQRAVRKTRGWAVLFVVGTTISRTTLAGVFVSPSVNHLHIIVSAERGVQVDISVPRRRVYLTLAKPILSGFEHITKEYRPTILSRSRPRSVLQRPRSIAEDIIYLSWLAGTGST
jgi:hypothetical protein